MSAGRSALARTRTRSRKPSRRGRPGIAELGKCQSVVVKLGGLGMLFGMFDFHTRDVPPSSEELAQAYKPYIETCIAAFGPDRGMFESNFPPEGLSSRLEHISILLM